jgi:hypothetical protein
MRINGVFCDFSGTVAYKDNTSSVFHAQGESTDLIRNITWTVDAGESQQTLANIWANDALRTAINDMWNVGGGSFSWTPSVAPSSKVITNAVFYLNVLISMDDGTSLPMSITCERGVVVVHALGTVTSIPSNIIALDDFFHAILNQVMVA